MSHSLTVCHICEQPWASIHDGMTVAWREITQTALDWNCAVHRIRDGAAIVVEPSASMEVAAREALYRIDCSSRELKGSTLLVIAEGTIDATGKLCPGMHGTVDISAGSSVVEHLLTLSLAISLARLCNSPIDDSGSVWIDTERAEPDEFVRRLGISTALPNVTDAINAAGANMAVVRRYLEKHPHLDRKP